MDLKTLWDRTNDAINTIIRRDESSETGDFLQPCIEGAHSFFFPAIIIPNFPPFKSHKEDCDSDFLHYANYLWSISLN